MKNKEIDFSNINYSSFREQLQKAIRGVVKEDAINAAQVAKLTQDKAKLELQIATLKKKSSDIQTQIDKLEGKG
jgi:hypothetical protein